MDMLANDFEMYKMSALCIQETHLSGHGVTEIASSSGKKYMLYNSGHEKQSINGVGIIVEMNKNVDFEPISDRICQITTKINNNKKLTIISAQAPTLEKSEKNPELRDNFYNDLNSVVAKVKPRNMLIIAGDYNAKTGSARNENIYNKQLGKYGKGDVNSNGYQLLEFAKTNDLKLVNTFFKHKQAHRTTWEAPERVNGCMDRKHNEPRRNPFRNQVDYICVRTNDNLKISDARSYGGMNTKSDHKLVMAVAEFKWPFSKTTKKEVAINYEKLRDTTTSEAYKEETRRIITALPVAHDNQQRWNNIVTATTTAAKTILGTKGRQHHNPNPAIEVLSKHQKQLKLQRDVSTNTEKREELRKERNKILNTIHTIKAEDETAKIECKITLIENSKNDSSRMFAAIKELKRMKPVKPLLIEGKEGLTADAQQQTSILKDYFQRQFHQNKETLPDIPPTPMRVRFTANEIRNAVNKLRNNRRAGKDTVIAEFIKHAPEEIDEMIATILNEAAETGDTPKELIQGILCAIQKPGKKVGPPEHLRPIILLSMLRKIAAICMKDRTIDRIDRNIPNSQAAYRKGRSTTEHVFAAKILAEKAMTSVNYTIHILLLDMSKAFDTVDRKLLINDLSKILEPDELHMLKIMINVELSVRCGTEESDFFSTDVGVPQGDGFSANEFTLYLAKTLKDDTERPPITTENSYCKPIPSKSIVPSSLVECSNHTNTDDHLRINAEYADDMTKITTDLHTIDHHKANLPNILGERNLHINPPKTEQYAIARGGDESWKTCKLLGSLLDTDADMKRRKGLAAGVIQELKYIFYNKRLNVSIKARVFDVFVTSIYMYNTELWTLTVTKEKQIDSLHRRLLRTACLNIRWPKIVTNAEVYNRTGATPWSTSIRKSTWNWFGHVSRLPLDSPAQLALDHATRPNKRPRGRPATTWISMMEKRFKDIGMSWQHAVAAAKDRTEWGHIISTVF